LLREAGPALIRRISSSFSVHGAKNGKTPAASELMGDGTGREKTLGSLGSGKEAATAGNGGARENSPKTLNGILEDRIVQIE